MNQHNDRTHQILATVMQHGPIASGDVVKLHSGPMTPEQVRKALHNLKQAGWIDNTMPSGGQPGVYAPTRKASARYPELVPQAKPAATTSTPKPSTRQVVEDALRAAGAGGMAQRQLAEKTGMSTSTLGAVTKALVQLGRAERTGVGKDARVVLTSELARAEAAKRERGQLPLRNSTTTERHWAPPELRPFEGRPGANDAFTLPSLVGGVRMEPKRPASMGTGAGSAPMAIGGGRRFSA